MYLGQEAMQKETLHNEISHIHPEGIECHLEKENVFLITESGRPGGLVVALECYY